MHPTANRKFFEHLPQHEQTRYVELLQQLKRLRLGCRCEQVGGKELVITVGYGLATAQFWLDLYGVHSDAGAFSPDAAPRSTAPCRPLDV